MTKVLKIENDEVSLGLSDGSIKVVPIDMFDIPPEIGDRVKIYTSDDDIIISKDDGYKETLSRGVVDGAYVNKWIYFLLAIVLGPLGLHKFYSKKPMLGVVYILVSLFIPFIGVITVYIISFVEGIIALMKTSDEDGYIIM